MLWNFSASVHFYICVCVPTTGDERLQQLLFGQALLHLHPHHVTAEPPCLLLWLVEPENRRRREGRWVKRRRGENGARCHGNKGNLLLLWAEREMEQEENLNEQRGLFQASRCNQREHDRDPAAGDILLLLFLLEILDLDKHKRSTVSDWIHTNSIIKQHH